MTGKDYLECGLIIAFILLIPGSVFRFIFWVLVIFILVGGFALVSTI